MIDDDAILHLALRPEDVTEWLRVHGWVHSASLGGIAQRWQNSDAAVIVPLLAASPDFGLRWSEMLNELARSFRTDEAGILLAVSKAGSDIVEFRAVGQIDDSLPLGDAATFIDSVRRTMQASANSALQPRSYYGHSLPDAARDYARNVRMGQTRRGSYVIPVISRLPILKADDRDDAVLFEEPAYQPFSRKAMLTLARGLESLRNLTHGDTEPSTSSIVESVGDGVSSELCDAVVTTLDAESITELDVNFAWAERSPVSHTHEFLRFEDSALPVMRRVGEFLKGAPVVGPQTIVGYVKRLDRGEDDEVGRIALRILDSDRARNVFLDLNDADYHTASEANTNRRMVSVTGVLHREPGRALSVTDVSSFRLRETLPLDGATEVL